MLPELAGIGATPAARASLAAVAKRWAPAISPTSLAAVSGPNPGSVEQLRSDRGDELGDLCLERLDRLGELADAPQFVAGDADAHRLLRPREAPRDPRRPAAVEQRAAGQLELGPEIVQMPLQRAVERDALTDEPFAVIDEQPQIQLGPVQVRGREGVKALLQRDPSDSERVDRIGLAALTRAPTGCRAQVGRDPQHPLAAADQKPLQTPETCRQSSSAQTRSSSRPRAQRNNASKPRGRPGRSARPASRRSRPPRRRACANACECPRQARSCPRPPSPRWRRTTGGHGLLEAVPRI